VRTMYLLSGDRLEAEELSQEALVRVYERWRDIAWMESPAGYLYRTAFNLHRKRVREFMRSVGRLVAGNPTLPSDPDDEAISRTDVNRALRSLPTAQREVLILREWLDLTTEDVARTLGINPSAARVRLHRARQALRDRLGGDYG